MRSMKIAMIGQHGIPARHGGVERAVEEVGWRLVERGHEVTVFNTPMPGADRIEEHRGIRIRYVASTHGKFTGNLMASIFSTMHWMVRPM